MAILSEFLGAVVSSVSNARVQSDLQAIKIAEEYAKNDLLKMFAVPRMRFSDVEIKIPVAMSATKAQQQPAGITDNTRFLSVAYNEILSTMQVDKLPALVSTAVRSSLATQAKLLDAAMKSGNNPKLLPEFVAAISAIVSKQVESTFKATQRPVFQKDQLAQLQENLSRRLLLVLEKEVQIVPPKAALSALEVIVEADKLKEIDRGSIMMITMKISEEGMEWHTEENIKGETVSKLMPE